MKIYISGKITGIEKEAEAIFEEAENNLKLLGYEVVNPLKLNHNHDKSWHAYMKEDIKALCDCDHIFMLDNWLDSKGARIEFEIACKLDIKIVYQYKISSIA